MRIPPFLVKGDSISLAAPSFGAASEPYLTRMNASLANLRKLGFNPVVGPNVFRGDGIAGSASPKERATEINEAFASSSKAVFSVGGGETMVEILPYVDFEAISKLPPKFFMGYSDNTNLTFLLPTLCDTASVYGPNAASFYALPLRCAEKDAMGLMEGKREFLGYPKYSISQNNPSAPLRRYSLTQRKIIEPVQYDGPFQGTLLGGCLDCLVTLCGTRFDKVKEFAAAHPEGIVWFLESCDLNAISIRRALFQLKEAGWFDHANGFLIGRPLHPEECFGTTARESYLSLLSEFGKPILYNVDLGHVPPSLPLLCGAEAEISMVEDNFRIHYLY